MNITFTERLKKMESRPLNANEEAADQRYEIVQEEQAKPRRGPKKRVNENSRTSVNFKWSWDWDACLDRYLADRKQKEHHHFNRTDVIVQVLKEFLTKEGYTPASEDS